jgi:predicted AlkP superfamily phosphohydrolase/phosphomutase
VIVEETMRALIFGVDGLAFRVIYPMMQAGYLPNFQALARDGVEAILESKYPPLTPPAWMSLITGLKPAKHGVYDFWEYDDRGGYRLVTRRKGGKAIWNLLSDYGKRVIVVNVPCTYPPDPVNGIVISGIQGASERGNFTYPAEFRDELLARVPDYRIDVDYSLVLQGRLTHAQAAMQLIEKRIALVRYLLNEQDWDFAFITFCASDYLQHLVWDEVMAMEPAVLRYYQLLDEALGLARAALGPDGSLFVVSDHGFQGAKARFAINEFLFRKQWLHSDRHAHRRMMLVRQLGKLALDRLGLLERARTLKRRFAYAGDQIPIPQGPYLTRQEQMAAGISVASRSCASGAYADLHINRPMSAQELDDLRGQLLEITDPASGERLVSAIYGTEVFGQGPFQPQEEHLLLLASDGYTSTPVLGQPWLWERERRLYGTHQKDGVFYACGPQIKAGIKGAPMEIYDVVPTVLRAMNQPLPDDLDGRVIEDIFLPAATAPDRTATQTTVARKLKKLLEN